ncbi:hypothetical protein ACIOMM_20110 [Streptomyces sp. NPDC087908]|uniref:hypothetical protein n=1 Tax=Streptomyces sp. NPDC087908 TaxID=3365820 RepID=UPI0037F89E63
MLHTVLRRSAVGETIKEIQPDSLAALPELPGRHHDWPPVRQPTSPPTKAGTARGGARQYEDPDRSGRPLCPFGTASTGGVVVVIAPLPPLFTFMLFGLDALEHRRTTDGHPADAVNTWTTACDEAERASSGTSF